MAYCVVVVAAGLALTLAGCGSSGTTSPPPTTMPTATSTKTTTQQTMPTATSAMTKAPASTTTPTAAPATTEAPTSTTPGDDPSASIQLHTIQFRAHPDRCIESVDANASSGSLIRLAVCDDQARHQSWLFDTDNSVIRSAVDSSKCLDISDADVNLGTFLQIWDCYFGDAQTWGYDEDPGRIYHCENGDCDTLPFCVDVPQNVIGSQIEIWNCDDKIMQSWSLGPSSFPPMPVPAPPPPVPVPPHTAGKQIQSIASSLCVDLPGGDASNGASLWLWECYGGDSQMWAFQNHTLVYAADTSKCVALLDDNSTNGDVLSLWDCSGGDSQQWVFDSDEGTLSLARSAASERSKCMQIGGENEGDPIVIWDCNDEQNQTWTIGSALGVLSSFAVV